MMYVFPVETLHGVDAIVFSRKDRPGGIEVLFHLAALCLG
ncbi:MAG: Unknown protein [uncultured Thiotrichaceae bacterium]|uniref:Uncharacterized protein n=1 Tax=uncultured Thiotrichaceae bacterium TaxID=298394 RepID=A0A6S6T4F1_9GAMM|nr:MAG: Unknown protein [uncultured Thiotrichaceae bacterium]